MNIALSQRQLSPGTVVLMDTDRPNNPTPNAISDIARLLVEQAEDVLPLAEIDAK